MTIRYSSIFRFVVVLFFVLILAGAQVLFSKTAGLDASSIEMMAQEGDFEGGAFAMMALIYSNIPKNMIFISIVLVGSAFLIYCTSRITTNLHALIITFLCIAPSVLAISTFQKDLLLVPFIIIASLSIEKINKRYLKYFILIVIYGLYAFLFRKYFIVIIASFIILLNFFKPSHFMKFILISALIAALIISPDDVFQKLQGSRDMVNLHRIGQPGEVGYRTAFMNLLPIDGPYSFIVNYIYAAIKLNLPYLFVPGLKEFFLGINIIIYLYFSIWGIRKGDEASRVAGTLILAHLAVLNLFEPDLGSYIRHLSTTLPFLSIPIRKFFEIHGYSLKFQSPNPLQARQ